MKDFISVRATLWARLKELAQIEVQTEAERIEESVKAREFWEWGPVENRIKHPIWGFDPSKQTPLQTRIMMAAKTNNAVCLEVTV